MQPTRGCGPVVVCLDSKDDPALLAGCGAALARLWDVSVYLAAVVVLPPQRPLGDLTPEEERTANGLLDTAAGKALESGVAAVEEIWIARDWQGALRDVAVELRASALVVGPRRSGPFGIFDATRSLQKLAPCPVIVVDGAARRQEPLGWPPPWLLEAKLP